MSEHNNNITTRKKDDDNTSSQNNTTAEIIASLALFCFGLFVLLSGLYMCFFAVTGTKVWYYSPGIFPAFIGIVLIVLSILLFIKKRPRGGIKELKKLGFTNVDVLKVNRLIISVGLFAIYVFIMIGRIPFLVATFIYLSTTMIVFRTKDYQIWKLLFISALITVMVYLFFGVIAAVPLP